MLGIGKQIEYYREKKGLTQQELADKMGYKSKSTISKIEKGINDINQSTVHKFAEALDITVAELLGANHPNNQSVIIDFVSENPEYNIVIKKIMEVKKEDIHLLVEILDRFIEK
ncbi:helix-turn-helix transcriptional regulator [Eubacterium sp.]|uniref:helix-turn-helix domain-containing protein n=1 Tax=Eubacterium sp. TaxID=142586 RepID=UPI0025F5F6DF|nr:helix-turn-helix transcriptional regulator [Eubacterium sp.]MCR5629879.1 helix-turn-helix domain-containing protein [Eubacterium sp.]